MAFHGHTYIWPWPILNIKIEVMHILIVNILQTAKDRANITVTINYEVACIEDIKEDI